MALAKYEIYMRQALELAEKGRGKTSPNPMVGALVVKGNKLVGEGFHKRAGSDHAEVIAIKKAGKMSKGATLFVTLEPCCHTGHTGPCTESIIKAGIKKVVIAVKDPNPLVNGKGIKQLLQANLEVSIGILAKEASQQNEIYFNYYKKNRPYIIMKIAQSLDGRIATAKGDSRWITSMPARKYAHRLRAEVDAVLVGSNTVKTDNPQLNVRYVKGTDPYRIVISSSSDYFDGLNIFKNNDDQKTIIATSKKALLKNRFPGVISWEIKTKNNKIDLIDFLTKADQFGIRSILVEGGSGIATSFLKEKLVDKFIVVSAPILLGEGINSIRNLGIDAIDHSIKLKRIKNLQLGSDIAWIGYPDWRTN